jgi:LemA protein
MTGLMTLVLCGIVLFSGCGYNEIQTMDEDINNKWAQVENQLKRRSDLVPNLVKVVKGYAKHESEVFTNIAEARSRLSGAMTSKDAGKVGQAEGQFNSALGRLLVIAEQYPQLKANEQFNKLMDELSGTENRISVARKDYNDAVRVYNGYIRQIPTNITAAVINAKPRPYYEPPKSVEDAPVVDMEN